MDFKETEQIIKIVNGKAISVNGVKDIAGADEEIILLNTECGRLTVEGRELKIESLNKNGGEILINGVILGVYKSDVEKAKRGGIFKILGR